MYLRDITLAEIIKNEIHSLSPRRKSVLELHLSGMNIEEIAIFLGWSDNQVRHLLYRGIQDLAEIIKNRMHDSCTRKNDKIK
jgi:DNA-directed RNA polymerase specialized sigma24 family protein